MKPETILTQWIRMVNHRDLAGLLKLYDRDAVILPTFSDRIQDTAAKRREYFTRLARRKNLSISVHPRSVRVHPAGPHSAILSGLYRWKFDVEGERITYEARFTFVVDPSRPSPILHHHSSQIPRMV